MLPGELAAQMPAQIATPSYIPDRPTITDSIPTAEEFYERFLYARGYLLTSFPAAAPKPSWRSVSAAGLHLSFDPANTFATADAKPWWGVGNKRAATVAILGYVLDTGTWRDDPSWIASSAAAALAKSETALLDLIDAWSGRFLLIFRAEGRTRILTDACALRSAYYTFRNGLCIASHARLAADTVGVGPSPLVEESLSDPRWLGSVGQFPGAATPFEDVWVLTPNTLIDVEARHVRRFFPRAPLPSLSSDAAAEIVAPLLAKSVQTVSARHSCVASLTGGIDSRVTLAAAKRARKTDYVFHVCRQRRGVAREGLCGGAPDREGNAPQARAPRSRPRPDSHAEGARGGVGATASIHIK